LRFWDPSTGRPLLQVPLTTPVERPRFSRDGRWLWAGLHGERAERLEVTPSREYRTLFSGGGIGVRSYNWGNISPDGRLLAVGLGPAPRAAAAVGPAESGLVRAGPARPPGGAGDGRRGVQGVLGLVDGGGAAGVGPPPAGGGPGLQRRLPVGGELRLVLGPRP